MDCRAQCRACARNDGECVTYNQPARIRDAAEVVVGVAKGVLDHGQPLEVVADLGFLGHADAAVELDRLLADELAGLADLHLGGGDRRGALFGALEIGRHGREHRHAAGLFERHEHVGGAVLQGLERADRNPELLAGLEILDGGLERFIHRADGFRAHRGAGLVDHALDQGETVLGIADRSIRADLDAGQRDVGGMQAVLGRIALAGDALGVRRHQEHADAALVALRALGARGHDQGVGVLAVQRDELLAVDDPARALLLGGGGNIGEIVARVLLELREGKGLAAVDDAGNVRGLLLGRAAVAQEAAGDHHRRQIRLQHQRLAERLHHDHGFDRAGAEAAIGFREGQSEQALLGQLAPDGLAPAALLLLVLLARIEIVGVGQETVDAFLEKALLLGQIKIHVRYSLQNSMSGKAVAELRSSSPRRGDPVITSPS